MKNKIKISIFFLIIIMCFDFTIAFSGSGSGTPPDPYQITTWNQLNETRVDLSASYILMNDLDSGDAGYDTYAGAGANGGEGWKPIGDTYNDEEVAFTGTFDGQGHTISDIYMDKGSGQFGFFGTIEQATISNLGILNISLEAWWGWSVGALVGSNDGGIISNCYSTGIVDSGGNAGGLVGYHTGDGIIIDSHSEVNVTYGTRVGGLVGQNYHAGIYNSYATGNVIGTSAVGGLIGMNQIYSIVDGCYATGDIEGDTDSIGGLIGYNDGTYGVKNSYATGNVVGPEYVGGLIGENDGPIENCYSTGTSTADDYIGGLMGDNSDSATNCFWDTETSGWETSEGGTGKTTAEMQSIETFSSWSIVEIEDYNNKMWYVNNGTDYPRLSWQFNGEEENLEIQIINPITSNPLSVSNEDNISIYFNFTIDNKKITNFVSMEEVIIGGNSANFVNDIFTPNTDDKICGNDCSLGSYEYTTSAGSCSDYVLAEPCSGASSCDGTTSVVDIWLNGTSFLNTDMVTVTAQVTCWSDNNDDVKFWYYDGDNWYTLFHDTQCDYSGSMGNYSVSFTINSSNPTQYVRVQESDNSLEGENQCYTGTWSDFDDISFAVSEELNPQFDYMENVGWQVNVTVPEFEGGLKDLFLNATYFGYTIDDTESNAISYGISDTCTYSGSGSWEVLFSDYCNISDTVSGDGSDLIITGIGEFRTSANISGFTNIKFLGTSGEDSFVYCLNGGCFV